MNNMKTLFQNANFPLGTIIMWSGSLEAVPKGWQLCDGTNGTPDLRDRFVVGAGDKYQTGDMGGSETVALTTVSQLPAHSHSHTLTGSITSAGAHTHSIPKGTTGTAVTNHITGSGSPSSGTVSTNSGGVHTHPVTITASSVGNSQPHNNLPPYYALFYIMKLKSITVEKISNNMIVMWFGNIEYFPSGWQFCDGSNGTPDLRDRFVVGAGDKYQTGDMGGSETVALTESQMPMHLHETSIAIGKAGGHTHSVVAFTGASGSSARSGGVYNPASNIVSASAGAHTHTLSTLSINATGSDAAHENCPPYQALYFMIKV